MTYYYGGSSSKKYEWCAFTEADLLANGKNGSDFGKGDSFYVGKATVKMATYDNDGTLSGGSSSWWSSGSSDRSGQDAYINGKSVGGKVYAEQYHVLKGSDGKTYYLIDMKVECHDSPGAGNGYFTFYGAQPPQGTLLTVTQTCSVSGSWIDYKCLVNCNTAPPNTPPVFTNCPENGILCVDENTKFVIDMNASDKDGDALTFSIVGGSDGSAFVIDPQTGVLTFKNAPDYEKPTDSDGNNSYKVIVSVSDGKGGVTNKELTVNVCDVKEPTPGDDCGCGEKKCIIIEAEDMNLSCFSVGKASSASDGKYIALSSSWMSSYFGSSGTASTKFSGDSGKYDFSIRFYDTAGADGTIKILVNGKLVDTISLNAKKSGWVEKSLEDLNLKKGDVIKLEASGKGCENVIIDKIEFCQDKVEPGALEGRVFFDVNKDGLDNNEAGVSGVIVQLLNAAGQVVGTATTAADGSYKFNNLNPGDYRVVFPTSHDGKVLTEANVGNDDRIDSDASQTTGQTGIYKVEACETVKDVDAGLIIDNKGPDAKDDAAKTCVGVDKIVDVLANDTDADGDSLTITKVAGQNIAEGQTVTLNDGVKVSLVAGQLVFDSEGSDYANLLVGQSATASYSYEISDGNGGIDTANINMGYCGSLNTLETIRDSLPDSGVMRLSLDTTGGEFYTALVTGTGDDRFDGKSFDVVFCGNANLPVKMGVNIPVNIYLGTEAEAPASIANPQNLDLVNWILNQDFSSVDNGDGNGRTYTEAEIQGAIWGLTDDFLFVNEANPTFGTIANAREIYDLAVANGEGYEAGAGDVVSVILDPTADAIAAGNKQPMIIGILFDDLAQDCLCY
ncbi:carboxypeptidase regulatory-like domain-containing protein [Paracoccus caeni]|uniref:Carboxypeptidase regulatory-like domain-containing protein n=1 Tax=Paracoccus caeni TaxID=657651 RepID=A0A934SN35_9RHOB|nr:SdrD B-like domain-containing protein [Paracoccus caeni]MBK4218134.1 carboxypeptidase regulatory-like domain-containing protein [Paracoccus caeni]